MGELGSGALLCRLAAVINDAVRSTPHPTVTAGVNADNHANDEPKGDGVAEAEGNAAVADGDGAASPALDAGEAAGQTCASASADANSDAIAIANANVAAPTAWLFKQRVPEASIKAPVFSTSTQMFHIRANVSNFISWATMRGVPCLFETSDLTQLRNESQVLNCIMDVARGARDCLEQLPTLITFEKQIEAQGESCGGDADDGAEMEEGVDGVAADASAPADAEEIAEEEEEGDSSEKEKLVKNKGGDYALRGQNLFIRCFNRHVVVRVGGGWDTLRHYLGEVCNIDDTETIESMVEAVIEDSKNPKKGKKGTSGRGQSVVMAAPHVAAAHQRRPLVQPSCVCARVQLGWRDSGNL